MRTLTVVAVCLGALVLAAAPADSADDEAIFSSLIKSKAETVVSIKFVLNVSFVQQGTVMGSQEIPREVNGVAVDKSGIVLAAGAELFPSGGNPRVKVGPPTNIRVVFPGDTRDFDAVLGAKDSKLGLAFVIVKDLAEKKITTVDMANAAEPKVGQTLYGVTRLDQGFDYAPMVMRTKVSGSVTKPRTMWILQGGGSQVGKPLYDAAGALTGIVVSQSGVGQNTATRPFLLPLAVAKPIVSNALKKSKAELDRILEEEEEAAAEAAEEKKDEKGDEKKDDKKKDASKDEPKKDGE